MRRRSPALVLAMATAVAVLVVPWNGPADEPGVEPETLTIGLHVPVTGASPLDGEALAVGADLYWRSLHDDKGILIHDRRVQVLLKDDQYTPTSAVAACNTMAGQGALLLIGFYGPDQIGACAGYAATNSIPYVSPGVQEEGLSDRPSYSALSATHARQGRTIAEYIVNVLGGSVDHYGAYLLRLPILDIPLVPIDGGDGYVKIGFVRTNTPVANDAEAGLRDALDGLGHPLDEVYTFVKEGSEQDAQSIAVQLERDAVDVVVLLAAPMFASRLINHSDDNDYRPRFVGQGPGSGFDAVAADVCRGEGSAFDRASFFTPWPAWSDVGDFDPEFAVAAQAYASEVNVAGRGDILVALWGLMKDVHAILEDVGPNPARDDIIAMLHGGYEAETGVWPALSYPEGSNFGADAAHRIEADCAEGVFRERDAFVTGYAES